MSKNIVVCCDGTGNQVDEGNLSNVLKLFQIMRKSATQRVYYNPGIGTIGTDDAWSKLKQDARGVFGLATGSGLDNDVIDAYTYIAEHYQDGDSIFLFGFSRGAYTVRVLAGFIHMVGLLSPDQANIVDYALTAYKRSSESNNLHIAWDFGRITAARPITIKFLGAWDTVASIIVPRWDRLVPSLQTLPYTFRNPSVQVFRHAMAIDERRRMFRLSRWKQPQAYVADPFDADAPEVQQDIKQVWFSGTHVDVGGGYPEAESGLSKFPLAWMIDEAAGHGLEINAGLRDYLVFGKPYFKSKHRYVPPDAAAQLHRSLTWAWKLLEWIPKRVKHQEWPGRTKLDGFYIPCGEPRLIENPTLKPRIHASVLERRQLVPDYEPVNLPTHYDVEPWHHGAASGPNAAAPAQPPSA